MLALTCSLCRCVLAVRVLHPLLCTTFRLPLRRLCENHRNSLALAFCLPSPRPGGEYDNFFHCPSLNGQTCLHQMYIAPTLRHCRNRSNSRCGIHRHLVVLRAFQRDALTTLVCTDVLLSSQCRWCLPRCHPYSMNSEITIVNKVNQDNCFSMPIEIRTYQV